jgi:hypothetical protein
LELGLTGLIFIVFRDPKYGSTSSLMFVIFGFYAIDIVALVERR